MKKLLLILPFLCLLCSCEPNEPKSEPEKGTEETISINFEDVSFAFPDKQILTDFNLLVQNKDRGTYCAVHPLCSRFRGLCQVL